MPVSLPPRRSRDWYSWALGITNAVNSGGGGGGTSSDTTSATASETVESSRVGSDTNARFERRADGSMAVGPGGTTPLRSTEAFWVIDTGAEPTRHGLAIHASSHASNTSQALVIYDHLGAPIFVVPKAGGPSVLGDNFRVFAGGEVFHHEISLRLDGTVQARRGDTAGGVGVFALGAATTAPTRAPDGSGTLDGSDTIAGAVLWVDAHGRVLSRRSSGPIDVIGGSTQGLFPPEAGIQPGDSWFNTGGGSLNFYNGAQWQRVAVDIKTKRVVTGNYTLVDGDGYGVVLHSAAASGHTVTLPSDAAATGLPYESAIPWRQYGAGQITFAAGSGASLVSRGSLFKSAGQYAEGLVTKVDASTWLVSGDLAA